MGSPFDYFPRSGIDNIASILILSLWDLCYNYIIPNYNIIEVLVKTWLSYTDSNKTDQTLRLIHSMSSQCIQLEMWKCNLIGSFGRILGDNQHSFVEANSRH